MPEGPEVWISSLFVNQVCHDKIFTGKPQRSSVTKNPEVNFTSPKYTIHSEVRGKEIALMLTCSENPTNQLRLLFRFGMSGRFRFTPGDELFKHSHLVFYTTEDPQNALSFVDIRRFGSWREADGWGVGRGPDPLIEYDLFCQNIMTDLEHSIFNKPICEVMLNQKYFNGIGNYLRSEILFRAKIPPFMKARDVLRTSAIKQEHSKEHEVSYNTTSGEDILRLCYEVPLEVINLKKGLRKTSDCVVTEEDYHIFLNWLQCYENPDMNNLVDHNGRTIWFQGNPGPLTPKVKKSRGRKRVKDKQLTAEETAKIKKVKLALTKVVPNTTKTKQKPESSKRNITTKRKRSEHTHDDDVEPPGKMNEHESKSITADSVTMETNITTDKPFRSKRIKCTEQLVTGVMTRSRVAKTGSKN